MSTGRVAPTPTGGDDAINDVQPPSGGRISRKATKAIDYRRTCVAA